MQPVLEPTRQSRRACHAEPVFREGGQFRRRVSSVPWATRRGDRHGVNNGRTPWACLRVGGREAPREDVTREDVKAPRAVRRAVPPRHTSRRA